MRLGLMLGYSGKRISLPIGMTKAADRMGAYAVWTAEAYGSGWCYSEFDTGARKPDNTPLSCVRAVSAC